MQNFDVAIVGAGPAGGQCARILAKEGWKVLLVERQKNFFENNFSSGVCPLSVLSDYDVSDSGVKSYWNQIEISSTTKINKWKSSQHLGVIFEFAELREFFVKEVKNNGGEVWMGHRYIKHCQQKDRTVVFLARRDENEEVTISTKVLVDATSFARKVIYFERERPKDFLKAIGFEYLIEVELSIYEKYTETLTFLIGHRWSPRGYAWIFPMQKNRLKVGMMHYDEPHQTIQDFKQAKDYAMQIIKEIVKPINFKVVDTHGSIAAYSKSLNDRYYKDNIIAIGDSVSTINYLGFEGIRHALEGSEIACKHIQDYLHGQITSFEPYQEQMQKYFKKDWNRCVEIAQKVYLRYSDRKIDLGIGYLKHLSLQNLLDILFDYKFEKFSNGAFNYLILKTQFFLAKKFSFLNR
jgi:digeranylgeranylglycerophospholipid reductase